MYLEPHLPGIRELLNRYKRQVDYLEIRLDDKRREFIHFHMKGIQNIGRDETIGGCVRSCHKGGWGFRSFASLNDLENGIQESIAISKMIGNSKTNMADVQAVQDIVELDLEVGPQKRSLEDKIGILESYVERFKAYPNEKIRDCKVLYTEEFFNKFYINSDGSDILQHFCAMDLTLNVTAFHEGVPTPMFRIFNHARNADFFLDKFDDIDELCQDAILFCDAKPMPGGIYPVVLDSIMAGTFAHESFGHTSEADLFASSPGGRDTLRIGRRFGQDILNIYDTGLMSNYSGSLKYDDEGVATEHTDLIQEGVLVGRLHTRQTAAEFDEKVTGNARAVSHQFPPIVRMRNTCIKPGSQKFEDLLDGIDEGVYACGLYGGHGGEDFSFIPAKGYMIRNGKLAEPVKNFSISGNLFETLSEIDAITGEEDFSTLAASGENGGCGKHEQFPLPVGMSAPRIRIRSVTVGGH